MRFKMLVIFLGFQLAAFGLYSGVRAFWPSFKEIAVTKTDQVLKPSAKGPSFLLMAENAEQDVFGGSGEAPKSVTQTIAKLPEEHTRSLSRIVLDYDPGARRGLGGASTIRLKAEGVSTEELNAVLIHEIGHVTDLGALQDLASNQTSEFKDGEQPIYEGDPSLGFYRISWINEKQLKDTAGNFDFVSGYAMSDPFEDFAESYAFYVLHNAEFRYLASENNALFQKYAFLKNTVFKGQEFDTGKEADYNPFRRVWDVTVLPYDAERFLN